MSARRTLRAILANTDSNRIQTGQFCTNAPGVSIGLQRRCEPAVINDLSRNAASGRNTSLINLSACRKKTRDYFAEAQLAHIHRLPVRYPPHAVLEWIKMPERRSKRDQRRIGDPPILGRRFLDSGDGLAPENVGPLDLLGRLLLHDSSRPVVIERAHGAKIVCNFEHLWTAVVMAMTSTMAMAMMMAMTMAMTMARMMAVTMVRMVPLSSSSIRGGFYLSVVENLFSSTRYLHKKVA